MNHVVFFIALTVAFAPTARAQDQSNTSPSPNQVSLRDRSEPHLNQWLASAFAGTDFGRSAQDSSTDFGGAVGYLWNGRIGGELAVSVTPNFAFTPAAASVISGSPMVNTYMAHIVGAMPFGLDHAWQPFISGGVGAIQMRPDVFNAAGDATFGTTRVSDTRFGGDLGVGLMGFRGPVGFKADVRYFRATGSYNAGGATTYSGGTSATTTTGGISTTGGGTPTMPNPSPAPGPYAIRPVRAAVLPPDVPAVDAQSVVHTALTGLAFWRANVGLALRW